MTPPAGYPHNRRAQHVDLALWSAVPAELAVLMTGTQAVVHDDGDGPCPDVLVFTRPSTRSRFRPPQPPLSSR